MERSDTCWLKACIDSGKCNIKFLYCHNDEMEGFKDWKDIRRNVLDSKCSVIDNDPPFNYGIYAQAL